MGYFTHGKSGTRVHTIWVGILNRCTKPRHKHFPRYGGRGITVCKRWLKLENFLRDMGLPKPGMTLERIDNNRGYSPANCRWATRKEQGNNRRDNIRVSFRGKTLNLAQWADSLGLNRQTIYSRYKTGNRNKTLFRSVK